jgi:hypothetical protein
VDLSGDWNAYFDVQWQGQLLMSEIVCVWLFSVIFFIKSVTLLLKLFAVLEILFVALRNSAAVSIFYHCSGATVYVYFSDFFHFILRRRSVLSIARAAMFSVLEWDP